VEKPIRRRGKREEEIKISPQISDAKVKSEPKTKPEGKKGLIWSYFELSHAQNSSKVVSTCCRICHQNVSPKIERLRNHFVNNHPHILLTEGPPLGIISLSLFPIPHLQFLNVYSNLTGGSSPPAVQDVPVIPKVKGDSESWIWKYFDRPEDERSGKEGNQAQCRLCLDLHDSEPDPLYRHLKQTHPGILEFCEIGDDTRRVNADVYGKF